MAHQSSFPRVHVLEYMPEFTAIMATFEVLTLDAALPKMNM
jgi:hypothetical protein